MGTALMEQKEALELPAQMECSSIRIDASQ